jgi:hypothetical protein
VKVHAKDYLPTGIYLLFLCSDGKGQGEIVFSMAALLKMRAITTTSATSSA